MVTGRFTALTMPEVTVAERPSGEPMAITVSPTRIWSAEPIATGLSDLAFSALSTAMS